VRVVAAVVVGIPFLLVPAFVGTNLPFYTSGLTQVVLFLSLGLLVRTSGQVSLCHSTFAAIGAVAFSQLAVGLHLPWLLALLLGGLVAVPVGALVALPAIRLSGLFLALATLAFAVMVERLLYPLNIMFTPLAEGRSMPRPSFAGGDVPYYYLVLAVVLAVAALMVAVHAGRLGRLLRGMSESPVALSTAGLSTQVTKIIVFCLSAFLAAVAGILYGANLQTAATTDAHYSSFFSVVLLASLAIAPFAEPWYAVFVGMTAVIPAYLTGPSTGPVMNALFGLFAIQVAMAGGTGAMPERWRAALDRLGGRRSISGTAVAPADAVSAATGSNGTTPDGLRVSDLRVRFGGLVAVKNLGLHAPMGRITGLIGPNGAGKTTTFNVCTGLIRPAAGRVRLHGRDVSRMSPAGRGRAGIGRTFQIMELCDSLTVAENVALGRESGLAGAGLHTQLVASRAQRRLTAAAARSAMELCALTEVAGRPAGTLSTGQRRLVELARCLAGPFDLLLLDEPSSGLDRDETRAFGDVLERVVRERGLGILLVEHDMSLVMRVCDYIYVLDFGELLFEGDPASVRSSATVRAAYLGAPDDLTEAAQ
jgi:ABC-type branched-subunit amino acid transport system ATPase component/ABC-type branched-subunit amino acid transport system permease subunit